MKIVKTCSNRYYVLNYKDKAITPSSMSLQELVVNVCLVQDYLSRNWKPAMGVPFEVLLEFDIIEDVRKAYPEYLV
jgi:hypothetical protein